MTHPIAPAHGDAMTLDGSDLAPPPPDPAEGGFYILSLKDGNRGRLLVWFRPKAAGYTDRLDFAGIYTAAQVDANPDYYNNGQETLAIPVAAAKAWQREVVLDDALSALFLARHGGPVAPVFPLCQDPPDDEEGDEEGEPVLRPAAVVRSTWIPPSRPLPRHVAAAVLIRVCPRSVNLETLLREHLPNVHARMQYSGEAAPSRRDVEQVFRWTSEAPLVAALATYLPGATRRALAELNVAPDRRPG